MTTSGTAAPTAAADAKRPRGPRSAARPGEPAGRRRRRRAGDPRGLREPRGQHDPPDHRARARRLGPVRGVHRRHPGHLHDRDGVVGRLDRPRRPAPGAAVGDGRLRHGPGRLGSRAHHVRLRRRPCGVRRRRGAHRHRPDGARRPGAARGPARQDLRLLRRGLDPPLAPRPEPGRRHRRPVGLAPGLRGAPARRPGGARAAPPGAAPHPRGWCVDLGCRRHGIRAPSGRRRAVARRWAWPSRPSRRRCSPSRTPGSSAPWSSAAARCSSWSVPCAHSPTAWRGWSVACRPSSRCGCSCRRRSPRWPG